LETKKKKKVRGKVIGFEEEERSVGGRSRKGKRSQLEGCEGGDELARLRDSRGLNVNPRVYLQEHGAVTAMS
jgi:hypothetical protein